MAIQVAWENAERTISRWTFVGAWTWDEFAVSQAEFHDMLRAVDHKVDVIADLRESRRLPNDTVSNFKRAESKALPNRDRVVLVSTSVLVRSIAATFNQVFRNRPTHFLLANTIKEAQRLLQQPREEPV